MLIKGDTLSKEILCEIYGTVFEEENCQYCEKGNAYSERYGIDCDHIIERKEEE